MSIRSFLKEMNDTFILHAVASHFINGLVPIAVLYLLLSLVTADPFFEHTVLHVSMVSLCTIPVSFISGIRDWRHNFRGARAPIFHTKIKLSIVLMLLTVFTITVRLSHPDALAGQGIVPCLYIGSLISMLPVVILLGHFGGKLASQTRR